MAASAEKLISRVQDRTTNPLPKKDGVVRGYYDLVHQWHVRTGLVRLTNADIEDALEAIPESARFTKKFDSNYLTDSCYNTVNKGDKVPKYLFQTGEGEYDFVNTEWDGETAISWAPRGGTKTIVGRYAEGRFTWDFAAIRRAVE